MDQVIDFKLIDRRIELWNLCAGLKRELVKLLVHAYRVCRRTSCEKVQWVHVTRAYESVEFSIPRRDVKLLIAHAGQGGTLRKDLTCPFEGPETAARGSAYAQQLREARQQAVARATVEAAMTAEEKRTLEAIKAAQQAADAPPAQVIPLQRRKGRTLEALLEAGRGMRESLGREPQG